MIRRFSQKATGISPQEKSHFNQLASTWWDVAGPQRILHKMNILRMDFIRNTVKQHLVLNKPSTSADDRIYIPPYDLSLLPEPIGRAIQKEQDEKRDEIFSKLKFKALDIGCGGGILTECLARLHQVDSVKGIDLSEDVLAVAKTHKSLDPMIDDKINYQLQNINDLKSDDVFDIVTLFEVLEHVTYPSEMLMKAMQHVKPGGFIFLSTINRDFISWLTTIFVAEHLIKIVPKGTHTYEKYINQHEIAEWFAKQSQFKVVDAKGCVYLPACGWKFTKGANVGNYFMAIKRV